MPVTQGESLDFERYYLGDFVDPHDVSGNGYVAALMGSPSRPLAGLFKIEVSGVTEFVNLHQFVPDVTQQSQANAVNDHGQVAGVFGDDEIPVLWNPLPDGTYAVTSLPVPADAEDGSEAFDCCEVYGINNSGWIVGASQVTESTSGQTQAAVVWRPTANGYVIERLPDVGTPPRCGNAYQVNNLGVVVGEACNGSQGVLGAWSLDSNGTWVVRNLGPSASSPSDIHDAGEIAAPTALDGVQALLSASNGDYQRVQLQDAQFVGGINAHGVIAGSTIDGESAVWAVTRLKGFDPPVDGGGVLNSAKAGSTIPLKWRVVDTLGRPVTDLTNVALSLNPVSCAQFPKTDAIEEYEPSSSDLKNLGDGYYQLNWKTSKSLSRTCQRLDLEALKGGSLSAVFMFR